ncbi:hypothetical protein Gotur_016501 [Gossypium turneri]
MNSVKNRLLLIVKQVGTPSFC